MLITGLISVLVMAVVAGVAFASRRSSLMQGHFGNLVADRRGIALQTVIIMVVLLVIAGGVAAVLLQRGNAAVQDLEDTDVQTEFADIESEALCDAAGGTWGTPVADTCQ